MRSTDNALKQQDGRTSKLSASTTPIVTTKRANGAVAGSTAMFASAKKEKQKKKKKRRKKRTEKKYFVPSKKELNNDNEIVTKQKDAMILNYGVFDRLGFTPNKKVAGNFGMSNPKQIKNDQVANNISMIVVLASTADQADGAPTKATTVAPTSKYDFAHYGRNHSNSSPSVTELNDCWVADSAKKLFGSGFGSAREGSARQQVKDKFKVETPTLYDSDQADGRPRSMRTSLLPPVHASNKRTLVADNCSLLSPVERPSNTSHASQPGQVDREDEANTKTLILILRTLHLHHSILLDLVLDKHKHDGNPLALRDDSPKEASACNDVCKKEKGKGVEEQQDALVDQEEDAMKQGAEDVVMLMNVNFPKPIEVHVAAGDKSCSFVGRRRGVANLPSRAWSCIFLLLFMCIFCGLHYLHTPTGKLPVANSTSTLACVIGNKSFDSGAVEECASASETSGTLRDAAAVQSRMQPCTGDARMNLRVTEMDSLEVGIVAAMKNSLENENRSIDGLTSRSEIYKILQNVRGDGCGTSAEDSQHGTAGIEDDKFISSNLRAAKEKSLDCNDEESSLRNRINGNGNVCFFFFFSFFHFIKFFAKKKK